MIWSVKSTSELSHVCACYVGKWELTELETDGALDGDIGLVMSVSKFLQCCHIMAKFHLSIPQQQAAKHYAIAAKLDRTFKFQGTESLVVQ